MVFTISCFLLFSIITLTNGAPNYYNKKTDGLVQKLSKLREKYGLNFAHTEGMGSSPKHFKKYHPDFEYNDHNPEKQVTNERLTDNNNIPIFNLLGLQNKLLSRTRDKYYNEEDEINREFLRMCKKKPKEYHCTPVNSCEPSSEETEYEDICDYQKKKQIPQKRIYRAGDNKEHETVDETAILLNDLEKQLLRNGVYKVFVGCVGKKCGGRSSRNDYDEGRDNTEGNREYVGCIGDGCGRSRNDDDDTNIRIY